jgi:signal transduction histidine kinase
MKTSAEVLFNSGLWQTALEKYALATNLTVGLYRPDGRAVLGPIHPTPLFQLFEKNRYDPGILAECVRRCLAQTQDRPAVAVSQFRGLSVIGTSLVLEGEIVGAAAAGYAFCNFSQVSEVQGMARQAGIDFADLWAIARKQPPVSQSRLTVYGELLQVLGDALLKENGRTRRRQADLTDTRLLQSISAQLLIEENIDSLYEKILDAAVTIMDSQYGSMQMFYLERGAMGELRLLSFRGFNAEAAKLWEWVSSESAGSTCGEALRTGKRVIAADVEKCDYMAGTQDLATYLRLGIRACQSTPLFSRSGKILGMISTHWREPHLPPERSLHLLDILARQAADLIERKQAEGERERLIRELERSNAELARFSHAVSHDLQAPARTIRSFTQLLARRSQGKMAESEAGLLDMIVQGVDQMQDLIVSLLNYARVGRGEVNREAVPVGEVVEDVRSALASLIDETQAQVICGALPTVEADPVLLTQLLQNLVTNAIRYRRPEEAPVIEIAGESGQGECRFAVKDNGQGIPCDSQQEIFEPLKRLHGNDVPGSGLGLALCRTVVERHGGRIWVESEGAGCGATFYFTLPQKRPVAREEEACLQVHGQSA